MGSVTTKIPKPLAKIGNYSILHRKILNYSNQGYNDFIIAVGYKGNVIIDYITFKYYIGYADLKKNYLQIFQKNN